MELKAKQKTRSKAPDIDWKKYRPTGCAAVDTLVACLYSCRKRRIPVKYINVKPLPWEQLKWYFRDLVDEHESDEFTFILDSVTVRKGSVLQEKAFETQLWE